MKYSVAILAVLLLGTVHFGQAAITSNTNHDMTEAIIALTGMMRENTNKLERHELRDKQTDDTLKKNVGLLTKRMSAFDTITSHLVKLDERMNGLEHLVIQKDDRERVQQQRTLDSLEDLQARMEGWATEIESKVIEASNRAPKSVTDKLDEILSRLSKIEAKISDGAEKVDATRNTEYGIEIQPDKLHPAFEEVRDMCRKMHYDVDTSGNQDGSSPGGSLEHIQNLLQKTVAKLSDLPSMSDLKVMHNETHAALEDAQHTLKNAIGAGANNIEKKIFENNEQTQNSLSALGSQMKNNADHVNRDLKDLERGQAVMVEMADHVLDTKKRLEHAYKILQEVGEMVMIQGMNMNHTIHTRFDGISNEIIDNQSNSMANLTLKMEQEINQVWRQINVMYQKMIDNEKMLKGLREQNEVYVNGTTTTMDGMESKVGEITKRMTEVDTNLNFLLGRLSLITQEFNQIKSGLGEVLEKIKDSFREVQERANDLSNPGPHPVPLGYTELDSSTEIVK